MLADLLEDAFYKMLHAETDLSAIGIHKGFSFDEMEPPCVSLFAQRANTEDFVEVLTETISVIMVVYTRSDQTRADHTALVNKLYDKVARYDLAANLNAQAISGVWVNQYTVTSYDRDVQEDRILRTSITIECMCCQTGTYTENHNAK